MSYDDAPRRGRVGPGGGIAPGTAEGPRDSEVDESLTVLCDQVVAWYRAAAGGHETPERPA
jgi:hypothetical protein